MKIRSRKYASDVKGDSLQAELANHEDGGCALPPLSGGCDAGRKTGNRPDCGAPLRNHAALNKMIDLRRDIPKCMRILLAVCTSLRL